MKIDRLTRVNEELRREIGNYLFRVMHESQFDLAAVTVTHVITSSDLRKARVLISIRDHQDDRRRMMALLDRHRAEIQRHLADKVKLKYTPRLTFELDHSLENGDRVLQLLDDIAVENPPADAEEDRETNDAR